MAAVLVPVLVVRALRHPNPVLPVRLFAVRTFSVATLALLLFSAAFFAVILCNVLFLTGVWQYSVLRTALAVLPSPLLAAALSPITGRLADRYGFRVLVVPGALSMAAGVGWFVAAHRHRPVVRRGLPAGLGPGRPRDRLRPAHPRRRGCPVAAAAAVRGRQRGRRDRAAARGRPRASPCSSRSWASPGPAEALDAFHRSWTVIAATAAACAVVSLGLASRPAAGRGPAGRAGRLRTSALHPRRSP